MVGGMSKILIKVVMVVEIHIMWILTTNLGKQGGNDDTQKSYCFLKILFVYMNDYLRYFEWYFGKCVLIRIERR